MPKWIKGFEVELPPEKPKPLFRQLRGVYAVKKKYRRPGKHNRLLLKKMRSGRCQKSSV